MTMLNREDSVKECSKSFLKHLSTLGESRLRVCEEDPSKLAAQHSTWCLANRDVFKRSYTKNSWNLKKLLRELKATGKAREVSNSGGDNRRMFIVFETQVGRMNSRTNSNADDNDAPADINHSNFKLAGSKTFLERNKGGIVIDEPLTFEIAAFNTLNERNVKIQNKSDNVKYLSEVSILGETHSGSFEVLSNLNGLIRINKNSSIHVKIRFQPRAVGQCKALFVFRFNGFVIGRFINATCGDADIYAATAATAPYKRSRRREALKGSIVDGEPPRGGMGTPYVRGMKPNGIPKAIERMGKGEMREFLDIVANNLDEDFEKNYKPCFKHMLHAEEICLQENLSQFNLEHITMSRKGSLLELHVRGLEEKRPSILVRDDVYATGVFPGDSNKYKGYVHQVQQESVMLKFSKRFHERYSKEHRPHGIEFNFSRRTMKVLLQSVDLVHSSSAFIRPLHTPVHTDFPDDAPIGQWFNKSLNDVQRHVVRNILRRYPHAGTPETNIPYVIFGPPGTGMRCIDIVVELCVRYYDVAYECCAS